MGKIGQDIFLVGKTSLRKKGKGVGCEYGKKDTRKEEKRGEPQKKKQSDKF